MDGGTACKVILGVLIALLQALGWFMSLGGAGKLHNECNDYLRDEDCEDIFRPVWWSVFYQLIALLIVTVVVAFGGLGRFRIPVVALLVISTVRTMEEAERGLELRDRQLRFVEDSAVDAFIGGAVLMSIVNFMLIALVGNTAEVNLETLNHRMLGMMGGRGPVVQGPGASAVGTPAPAQPPPTQVDYPKHGGFEAQPPTFDYTQQQQQQQQQQSPYPTPPPV